MFSINNVITSIRKYINSMWRRWNSTAIKRMRERLKLGLFPLRGWEQVKAIYFPTVSLSLPSILYWTTLSQSGHGIGYMSLENTSAIYCLNISGRQMIDKLTFEPSRKSLYWVNKMNAENSTIERYDIQTGQLSTVAAYATNVTGIINGTK